MNTSSAIASKWTHFTEINPAVRFIDVTLRGCAQVMFQNNPLTGLIFFIAIFIAAYGEGNPAAAYGCVLGTVVATFTGMFGNDRTSWLAGLYGYTGCLVGVALPTFLHYYRQHRVCYRHRQYCRHTENLESSGINGSLCADDVGCVAGKLCVFRPGCLRVIRT